MKSEIRFGSTITCREGIGAPKMPIKLVPLNQMLSLKIGLKWFQFWYLRLIVLKTFIHLLLSFQTLIFFWWENMQEFILTDPRQNLEYSSIIFDGVNLTSKFLTRNYCNSIGIYLQKFLSIFQNVIIFLIKFTKTSLM